MAEKSPEEKQRLADMEASGKTGRAARRAAASTKRKRDRKARREAMRNPTKPQPPTPADLCDAMAEFIALRHELQMTLVGTDTDALQPDERTWHWNALRKRCRRAFELIDTWDTRLDAWVSNPPQDEESEDDALQTLCRGLREAQDLCLHLVSALNVPIFLKSDLSRAESIQISCLRLHDTIRDLLERMQPND